MKRIFSISILGVLMLLISTSGMLARSHKYSYPDNFLTFSCFVQPFHFGYKHRVHDHVYVTGNMDYLSSNEDLEFQAGAVYLFPPKIIIFKLYGGGGFQFSRNEGYQYPYVTVGTNFLFLFTEIVHPLEKGMSPKYRFGFSFKF